MMKGKAAMSKHAKNLDAVVERIIQEEGPVPTVPVEAPQQVVDSPLDVEALEKAIVKLNAYAAQRSVERLDLADKHDRDLLEFLLKGEEAYFQSLKDKVALVIRGATRIA